MLERADHQRRVTWLSLLGLILVPVILAAGFLWATWGSADRLHQVNAAVVNADEAVKLNGQLVPLGRQLAGGLVDSPDKNFRWKLVNATEGRDGLEAGRYVAVVTIPKDFSSRATSFSGKPNEAEQAKLDVKTSDITGVTDASVANRIAEVARQKLNSTLTENYLDKIYLGFNDTKKNFGKVADGAGRLAEGASELSSGVSQASDGVQQLNNGMGQLAAGGSKLDSGAAQLASGAQQYSAGVSAYTSGVHQLSGGTHTFAAGVRTFKNSLPPPTSAKEIAKQKAGLDQLAAGMTSSAVGARGLSTGLTTFDQSLPAIGKAAGGQVSQQGCQQFQGLPNEQQLCEVFTAGARAGAEATATAASGVLHRQDPKSKQSLLSGSAGLAEGLGALSPPIVELINKVKTLPEQQNRLTAAVTKLAAGADQLASGAGKLDSASGQLNSGGTTLASGAAQLSSGIGEYTGGVSKVAASTPQLASGMKRLDDGTRELATGTRKFADELDKGAAKIPSYSKADRSALATVVANPVKAAADPDSLLSQVPAVSLLMVLALWLGGFATYLVVQAVAGSTLLSSRPTWQLVAKALAPGVGIVAVQALAVTLTGQAVLDLSAGVMLKVLVLLLFGGVVFVAVNHALVAWLGGWGRLLSVIAVVLTAAGAITSAVPPLLESITPYLPLTPVLVAARSIITGGDSITPQIAALLLWLLGSFIASVAAVLRQRTITPAQLRLRYA